MDEYSQQSPMTGMADYESASRMMHEAPASTPGAWTVEDVSVKQAANGGFIVRCNKRKHAASGGDYQSKEYTFASLDDVAAYLAQEFASSAPGGSSEVQGIHPAGGMA